MMPSFSPELISTMRAALDDVMTHIPVDQATYELLYAAAFGQIQAVLSLFT